MTHALKVIDTAQQEQERRNLIRATCAKDATDIELEFFLAQCQRLGLDPLLKQLYFMKRSGRVSIELSIDGYRAVADQTGEYAGSDEPAYKGHEEIAPGRYHPQACSVTVYRIVAGQRCPFTGRAFWQDFYNPTNPQWNRMPYRMLAIRAETEALKKAFPRQLSGIYTPDEMEDSHDRDTLPQSARPPVHEPAPPAHDVHPADNYPPPGTPPALPAIPEPPAQDAPEPAPAQPAGSPDHSPPSAVTRGAKAFVALAARFGLDITKLDNAQRIAWIKLLLGAEYPPSGKLSDAQWDTVMLPLRAFVQATRVRYDIADPNMLESLFDRAVGTEYYGLSCITPDQWAMMRAYVERQAQA